MSLFVIPSEEFEAVIDTGESGLVGTIGLLLVDNQGATVLPFSALTIIETPGGSGVYAATRVAPAPLGQYTIVWQRGSGGETFGIEDLLVTGVPETNTVPPVGDPWDIGPCQNWISGADVLACCGVSAAPEDLDVVAIEASAILYAISGRQFSGICGPVTVRPCKDTCGCFGSAPASLALGDWAWRGTFWQHECGDTCGCSSLSRIRLNGYPVRAIVEVKIDGEVIDPDEYKLVRWRFLTRQADSGPPVEHRKWPGCQDLALDDDQPGTFSVTYRYGVGPPEVARMAAAQLACQLYLSCGGSPECQLPAGVTKVDRQGITVERGLLANWFDPNKPTGLVSLDAFIRAYWGKQGSRRPAVWSPDLQPFARREGV